MKGDYLREIIAGLFGAASRADTPQEHTLSKGLVLKARVTNDGRREILAFRAPGGASSIEATVVRRACGFECHEPVPFSASKGRNGWQITEKLESEIEAHKAEITAANQARASQRVLDRVEVAVQLMLEIQEVHRDNVQIYGDLWREGLAQLSSVELETEIKKLELQRRELKKKVKVKHHELAI